MLRYTLRRLFATILILWLMVSVVFMLSCILPGTYGEQQVLQSEEGFYDRSSGKGRTAAYQQLLARTNQQLPLFYFSLPPLPLNSNQAISVVYPNLEWHGTKNQYHYWASQLLRGSLGVSYINTKPVIDLIGEAAGNTLWILLTGMTLTIALALLLSIAMATGNGRKLRRYILPALMVLDSFPFFVLCLILLLLLANPDMLQLLPAFGLGYYATNNQTMWDVLIHKLPYLVLPVLCLVLANLPYLTNQFYSSLAGTLQTDYIRTARAKGLTPYKVVMKHALRNALLPVITVLSDMLPVLVAGTVVIEVIFAISGVGQLLVASVMARDFPVIVGIVAVTAMVKMVSNFVADICYSLADPRIRNSTK